MSAKNLSWGGDSGQLDVGIGCDGTVTRVTLWRRLTLWDEWQRRLPEQAPRVLANPPSLIVWEKTATNQFACK